MVDFESSSTMAVSTTSVEESSAIVAHEIQPIKKKRNLPGMPGNFYF